MTESDLDGQQPFTLSQNGTIAVASATVSMVTLIIGFVIGFLCGHFCRKQRKMVLFPEASEKRQTSFSLENDPAPNQKFYENALELQENASYVPVQ